MDRISAWLVALVALAGCQSPAFLEAEFAKAKSLRVVPDYRIDAGDNITIKVLNIDDEEGDNIVTARVRPDGKVTFPKHGDILAAGKTTEQLAAELEEEFKETLGLREPRVYVAANSFDSKNVTILGQVRRPGRYPYNGQMRVADVLGLAIDTDVIRSAPNQTLLFREIDGKMKVYHINLKDFFHKNRFETNFYIRPGDVIYVPRNGYAKVGDAVQRFLQPISAVFAGIGLGARTVSLFAPTPATSGGN